MLAFIVNAKAQDSEKTIYSETLTIDTICKPDYFKVIISIAEYEAWVGRGRKAHYQKVDLDSIEKIFLERLNIFGVKSGVSKVNLTFNNSNYSYRNDLYSAAYEFYLSSKDSVEQLCKFLKGTWLKGINVSPCINTSRIEQIKLNMDMKADKKSKDNVEQFAMNKKLKVGPLLVYTKNFNPAYDYLQSYYVTNNTNLIDLSDIKYTLSLYTSYSLK